MNDEKLSELRATVERAEKLQKQIKELGEFIASCKNEVGYLNVSMNYKNQGEIRLANNFEPRQVFDAFKDFLHDGAVVLRDRLELQYRDLEVTTNEPAPKS